MLRKIIPDKMCLRQKAELPENRVKINSCTIVQNIKKKEMNCLNYLPERCGEGLTQYALQD